MIAKSLAKWIVKAAFRRALGPLGLVLDAIDLAMWLQDYVPSIQSYFDEPLTLEELQSYADEPQAGYEVHHIVERTSASRDGFSNIDIEGYDNRVRIPTYKHHEITTWYGESNPEFGGLTPRQFLKGRSWEERVRVGKQAMAIFGVLK